MRESERKKRQQNVILTFLYVFLYPKLFPKMCVNLDILKYSKCLKGEKKDSEREREK